jgi:aldose sugar dehydrogenase
LPEPSDQVGIATGIPFHVVDGSGPTRQLFQLSRIVSGRPVDASDRPAGTSVVSLRGVMRFANPFANRAAAGRSVALLAICLMACRGDPVNGDEERSGREQAIHHIHADEATRDLFRIDTIAMDLAVPWDLAFAPDGRIFVTERPGRIRVIEEGVLRPEPWAELEVFGEHPDILPESGLLGIDLAPDFAESGHVFVFATVATAPDNAFLRLLHRVARRVRHSLWDSPDTRWESRIYRFTDQAGYGVHGRVVIDNLPASYYHAGGALAFGPDRRLYVTTGDVLDSSRAQDPESLVGKVLRFEPDGRIPGDNPIPGSPVFALGLRNPQGLAWHPETGELFAVEHGPSFLPHEDGRHGKDEINIIVPGGNYGWPIVAGETDGEGRFHPPIVVWTPAIAPPGLAFYAACGVGSPTELLVTGLRGQQLRRLTLEPRVSASSGWSVTEQEVLLQGILGRLRRVAVGPEGLVYLTTSNRDGRGQPRPGDDLLLRLTGIRDAGARTYPECSAAQD